MKPISSVEEFRESIASPKPTVAIFKADWCKDCRFMDPFMPEVADNYSDRMQFIVVDRDEFAELGEEYNVLGIPSFIAFMNGKETIRFVSKLRKTREEIEEFLDRVAQVSAQMSK